MKRFWWSWIFVFFLGLGTGYVFRAARTTALSQPPSFVQREETLPQATEDAPALWQPMEETCPATQAPGQQGMPWTLEYTNLVAHGLAGYDGPFLEDGSQEELVGICALLLENTANVGIEYAQVVVSQGSRELQFDATYIPPRGKVMILEKNRQDYLPLPVDDCRCRTLIPGKYDWEKDRIQIQPGEGFGMEVTNLTGEKISYVRIFYKQHDGQMDLHMGGITYCAVLPDLLPGESRDISPYRYASGYSAVVAVVLDP